MAKNFEVLGQMASRNLDIRMSTQMIGAEMKDKNNAWIQMRTDNQTVKDLALKPDKFFTILIVCDADQYLKIAGELDAK